MKCRFTKCRDSTFHKQNGQKQKRTIQYNNETFTFASFSAGSTLVKLRETQEYEHAQLWNTHLGKRLHFSSGLADFSLAFYELGKQKTKRHQRHVLTNPILQSAFGFSVLDICSFQLLKETYHCLDESSLVVVFSHRISTSWFVLD